MAAAPLRHGRVVARYRASGGGHRQRDWLYKPERRGHVPVQALSDNIGLFSWSPGAQRLEHSARTVDDVFGRDDPTVERERAGGQLDPWLRAALQLARHLTQVSAHRPRRVIPQALPPNG
eukprot:827955-Pyramimonas_sp.AAC.1